MKPRDAAVSSTLELSYGPGRISGVDLMRSERAQGYCLWAFMNILGISGLERSMPFKRARWPGLDEREYRISQGHDSAAALIVDGDIVAAAAEERFNGQKHTGNFPIGAIRYCLEAAGLDVTDIHELAHGFDYAPYHHAFMTDPGALAHFNEVFSRDALLHPVR